MRFYLADRMPVNNNCCTFASEIFFILSDLTDPIHIGSHAFFFSRSCSSSKADPMVRSVHPNFTSLARRYTPQSHSTRVFGATEILPHNPASRRLPTRTGKRPQPVAFSRCRGMGSLVS